MLIIFSVFTGVYVAFVFILILGWQKIKTPEFDVDPDVKISIIIAARNEAHNLSKLLEDLSLQLYPADLFEVIVVDDDSDDDTEALLDQTKTEGKINLKILKNIKSKGSPKKEAIQAGIDLADGELIMVTDADCRMNKKWLKTVAVYYAFCDTKFIAGPVKYCIRENFIGKLIQIEFSSLIGTSASTIYWGKPIMCNAANIAFPKKVFAEVNGFKGNEHYASGDDVFLMKKINERYPGQVKFLKHKDALVETAHANTFWEFVNQRIRWASKWKATGDGYNLMLPVFIFVYHLITIVTLILAIAGDLYPGVWIALFLVKFVAEYFFLKNIMSFFSEKASLFHYLVASFIYPFYAVFFGIAANLNTYKWKGRKY